MLLVTVKVLRASCYSRSAFEKEVGIISSSIPSFFGTKDKKSCEKLTVPPSLSFPRFLPPPPASSGSIFYCLGPAAICRLLLLSSLFSVASRLCYFFPPPPLAFKSGAQSGKTDGERGKRKRGGSDFDWRRGRERGRGGGRLACKARGGKGRPVGRSVGASFFGGGVVVDRVF